MFPQVLLWLSTGLATTGGGPAVPHMQLAFVRHFKCLFDFYNLFCSILSFSPVLTKLTTN